MSFFEKPNGKKYHSRTIEVTISDYDEHRLVIEGNLIDRRYEKYYVATGEEKAPGKLHHMLIHLLVNKSRLEIEEVGVSIPASPNQECPETVNSLNGLKGVTITKGFASKIRYMSGKGKGCTHLVELLMAMAPAIVQGVIAYRASEFPKLSSDLIADLINKFMNTCYAWRSDSVLVRLLKNSLNPAACDPGKPANHV